MDGLTRRDALRLAALGVGGACASGWMAPLAAAFERGGETSPRPPVAPKKAKACILLWMDGGPSHHDTFDPKPDAPEDVRGEYGTVATSAPGIRISDALPRVAKQMHHAAILRGMSTGEAEHGRARIFLHTGYKPGAGGLKYPTMGSLMTAGREADGEMPNFVVTGMHLNPANWSYVSSPGYIGPRHAPLVVPDAYAGVANLKGEDISDAQPLLDFMTDSFLRERSVPPAIAQKTMRDRALRLMRSPKARAFDLSAEPARSRERYGDHRFGQGCLLARRLVEAGVPFVEVYHAPTPGGWDSHTGARAKEVKTLALPQLDQGMSALLADLHERGLLKETLVVWMGEFGRTPRVKKDGGRDHYARAWSAVMAGGGVKGGQAVCATDATGAAVRERPVSAPDFMATVCGLLGVDANASFKAGDRPVKAVERGAKPVEVG